MGMTTHDGERDTPETCPACGKLSDADPCAGNGCHDEGFDRCSCEELATAERFEVSFYDPTRGGVWVRTFDDRDAADAFAKGRRCYGKPATAKPATSTRAA